MSILNQSFETHTFILNSERDLADLGASFGQALSLESLNVELSMVLGLSGEIGAGKTTFVKGMLGRFFSDVVVANINAEPFEDSCEPLGVVTHYDALSEPDFVPYDHDHALVIVEHVDETDHDPTFVADIVVLDNGQRRLQLSISEDFQDEPSIQAFLSQTQCFMVPAVA